MKNTTRIVHNLALAALLGFSCSATLATEEEEARKGCERVNALRLEELRAKGQKGPILGCQDNYQSPAFWQCVEDKMKAGNSWMYSTHQCQGKKAE